jgi:hypothetical protein
LVLAFLPVRQPRSARIGWVDLEKYRPQTQLRHAEFFKIRFKINSARQEQR